MEVAGNIITSIFCQGQTNAAGIGIIRQGDSWMLRSACLQCVIQFRASFSHIHLQPAGGCALQVASRKLFDKKKGRISHFTLEEVGWFSDMSTSRLPEYSSLVVSTVNGKVTGDVTSIFCHRVTCLGTNQCCWDGNHMPGWFMNVRRYVLVKVQACDPVSSKPFPHNTCDLHVALPYRLNPRNSLRTRKVGSETHLRWAVWTFGKIHGWWNGEGQSASIDFAGFPQEDRVQCGSGALHIGRE